MRNRAQLPCSKFARTSANGWHACTLAHWVLQRISANPSPCVLLLGTSTFLEWPSVGVMGGGTHGCRSHISELPYIGGDAYKPIFSDKSVISVHQRFPVPSNPWYIDRGFCAQPYAPCIACIVMRWSPRFYRVASMHHRSLALILPPF